MLITKFSVIDYLVFIALLVSSSLIGVFFAWKSRRNPSNSEFLTGNRKLAIFPVMMSLVASFMSTNTLLGLPAEVFQVGTQFSIQVISMIIAVTLAAQVFMPIYYKLNVISVNEYLAQRFQTNYIRHAGTIGFLFATMPYMAVVLYGPALALSSVTPLSISTSILVVGFICTFYTTIGGIKAVIWTDVLQCILMFIGLFIVIFQGAYEVGGFSKTWQINKDGGRIKFFNVDFDLYNHDNVWNVLAGTTVTWTAVYCVMQTQVQRYVSMKSASKAKRTLYMNLVGLMLVAVLSVMCGMVIYAKYHDCDPVTLKYIERHDQLMPYFVMETLSKYPGVPGLFVACIFSGSLSTLSSGYNALAAITWEDIIKPRIKLTNEKRHVNITKFIAMAYGLLSIALSFGVGNAGTVLQASLSITGSMLGPLLALFTLGVFWPFATAAGSTFGLICGICSSLVLSIGSLAMPRPRIAMYTSVDNCSNEILEDVLSRFNGVMPKNQFIESYDNPEGSERFFHISYLLCSVFGFTITLIIGSIASLFIGKRTSPIDARLMSPLSNYLFSCNRLLEKKLSSEKFEYFDNKTIEGIKYQRNQTDSQTNQVNHITSV